MVTNIRKRMVLYINVTYAFYLNCQSNVENERIKKRYSSFPKYW